MGSRLPARTSSSGDCLVAARQISRRYLGDSLATMISLDHTIPPLVIAVLSGAAGWMLAGTTPAFAVALPARIPIAALLVFAGVSLALAGVVAFRQASTTVDPRTPDMSTSIVRRGPFAFTRNPMYLGMALVLLGMCSYLANPLAVVGVVLFVVYITRFQIIPEERLLLEKFGEPFAQYMRSVRRWI